jgi:multisubunit Na+/H+ antiporter MnhB subunit
MKRAGIFDIRNIIGALLTIYGVILLLVSFSTSEAEKARADGINANLWVGITLLVVGLLMILWAVTRPIIVDEAELEADKRAVDDAAGRRTDEPGPT